MCKGEETECSRVEGSLQCFTVVLTFKKQPGELCSSLLLTLLTLDYYHCSKRRQSGMFNLYRASTMHIQREETEKSRASRRHTHTHTLETRVKQTRSLLTEERTKSSLSHSVHTHTHTLCIYKQSKSPTDEGK